MKLQIESVSNGYIVTDFDTGDGTESRQLFLDENNEDLVKFFMDEILGYGDSYGETYYLVKGVGRKVGGFPVSLANTLKAELESDLGYMEDQHKEECIKQIEMLAKLIQDRKE